MKCGKKLEEHSPQEPTEGKDAGTANHGCQLTSVVKLLLSLKFSSFRKVGFEVQKSSETLVNVFSRGLGERKMTLDGECKLLRGLLEDKKKAGVMISSMWH